MRKAICKVSVSPVRAQPDDKSEMLTQMLYGEGCEVLEIKDNFTRVRLCYDHYQGWLDTKQIEFVSDVYLRERKVSLVTRAFEPVFGNQRNFLLSMGSEVEREVSSLSTGNIRDAVISTAKAFLGVPYLWGGRSFFGIDCSGFSQLVYKVNRLKVPRDAYEQAEVGRLLGSVEEAKPGDLAFFEKGGRIVHVGILLSSQEIIHAFGEVRVDAFDALGILDQERGQYSHKLGLVRSVLDDQ